MKPKLNVETKYRLIYLRELGESMPNAFLQFKSTKRRWFFNSSLEECWRFVPEEHMAVGSGSHLFEEDCPTKLRLLKSYFVHTRYDNPYIADAILPWRFSEFLHQWSDIYEYFIYLRKRRQAYLEGKKLEKKKNKSMGRESKRLTKKLAKRLREKIVYLPPCPQTIEEDCGPF